jgi:predicted transcriptional regulator
MTDPLHLSRRERQIMDIVFAHGEATVLQIQENLPDPPSGMAIRRMLSILEEKGHLKRRKRGREFHYAARQGRKKAGRNAFQHVLDTFFEGSVEKALATHLEKPSTAVSMEEYERLARLIAESRKKGK